jgi:thiol-disulfide isomerase/thioredoxin
MITFAVFSPMEYIMMQAPQPSFGRFIALLMIGAGLIAIGSMLYIMRDESTTAAAQDFSAVPAKVDYKAPNLTTLTNLDGKAVTLSDYRGKVVLVNLWATWCPPCREEMPTLQAFYEKHKGEGFVLIAINQEETRNVVAPFVEEYGLTFPVWLDLKYEAERKFNTANLPSSYVIDRNGRVRLMWIGGISESNLEKYVPAVIQEK